MLLFRIYIMWKVDIETMSYSNIVQFIYIIQCIEQGSAHVQILKVVKH